MRLWFHAVMEKSITEQLANKEQWDQFLTILPFPNWGMENSFRGKFIVSCEIE